MDLILILIACMGTSGVFVMSKFYQTKYVKSKKELLMFSFWFAVGGFIFSFALNNFKFDFTPFSLCLSLIVAATIGFDNIAGVIAMKYCKISLYTIFIMAGGMIIPSVMGAVFLNETVSICRFIGIIALVIALVIPVFEKNGQKTSKLGFIICFLVFFSNGTNNVASKLHQIDERAVGTQGFLIWVNVWMIILSLICAFIYYIIMRRHINQTEKFSDEIEKHRGMYIFSIIWILLSAFVSGIGQTCNLYAAKTVDASLLYPLTTCGSIILSAVAGRLFFKEKITKQNAASIFVSVIGTVLFAL